MTLLPEIRDQLCGAAARQATHAAPEPRRHRWRSTSTTLLALGIPMALIVAVAAVILSVHGTTRGIHSSQGKPNSGPAGKVQRHVLPSTVPSACGSGRRFLYGRPAAQYHRSVELAEQARFSRAARLTEFLASSCPARKRDLSPLRPERTGKWRSLLPHPDEQGRRMSAWRSAHRQLRRGRVAQLPHRVAGTALR